MNVILFEQSELTYENAALTSVNAVQTLAFLPKRDERALHLLKVLRKKEGDTFDAGVLEGKLGTGLIQSITDGINITLTLNKDPPCRTLLRLGVGFPRPIQLRRLLRDCASFGLQAIDLISTELGEKSYRDTKLLQSGGARAALIEGAIQACDTRLPQLATYNSLKAWLQSLNNKTDTFNTDAVKVNSTYKELLIAADNVNPQGSFADLDIAIWNTKSLSAVPLSSCLSCNYKSCEKSFSKNSGCYVLAIGSERGWSDRERDLLEQAGFLRLSLGPRVLRTETACTAAIVLLMERMGVLL